MIRKIQFILLLALPNFLPAAERLEYESQSPSTAVIEIQSLEEGAQAIVYQTTEEVDQNLFKQGDTFIQIIEPAQTWWVQPPNRFDTIGLIEFIDDHRLLIELSVPTTSTTALLDLNTKVMSIIGGGRGHYIRTGRNQGLIELKGRRSYLVGSGTFWFSSLVDLEGNLVEILSAYSDDYDCLTIGSILNVKQSPPTLRQTLDECIGQ